jgi:hypothetical protein
MTKYKSARLAGCLHTGKVQWYAGKGNRIATDIKPDIEGTLKQKQCQISH